MSKQDKTIIFVIIAVVTILVIGSTFAYFTWVSNASQKTTVSFTSGAGFSCSANGGGNITSNDIYLAPTTCTDATRAIKRTITVGPTITQSDSDIYLNMWLKVNSIGSGLSASNNFKYALTTDGTSCTSGTVVAQGNFNGAAANDQIPLLEDKAYSSTTTDTYYLWIWLDAAETSPDTQNQTFNLELGGLCTNQAPQTIINTISEGAVMDNIISTYVTASTGVDFSAISSDTNGKGIYIRAGTENASYPIYYYRGEVTNNNVLFGGFCWKIVRTTSTGGTKLIYNGTPTGTSSNECNNTGTATQLASTRQFNNTAKSPADAGYMYGTRYQYSSSTGTGWYYAPDVTYSNGRYTLVSKGSYNVETKSTISGTNLKYHHYTCASKSAKTCTSVRYVYYVSTYTAYYITLTNGKKVEDALDEMLTSSSNANDSNIKTAIDTWYAANMTSYTSKLEDTPYCNDRTIYRLGGWSPTGDTETNSLYFGSYERAEQSPYTPSLTCSTNDAFTVNASNGNGKLTYPVGLLTVDEIRLGGGRIDTLNSTYYLYTGESWWSGSPLHFGRESVSEYYVYYSGYISFAYTTSSRGVRPAVSLKAGTKFASGGDGTPTNPYVVE